MCIFGYFPCNFIKLSFQIRRLFGGAGRRDVQPHLGGDRQGQPAHVEGPAGAASGRRLLATAQGCYDEGCHPGNQVGSKFSQIFATTN